MFLDEAFKCLKRRNKAAEKRPLLDDELGEDNKGKEVTQADNNVESQDEEEKIPYPKSVFFILSTEACERFSYYGMRAILSLYLRHLYTENKGWEQEKAEDVSTIIYHAFVFLSYFTSLFGAFLADSFLGKFKTIFYISIVYAIGQCILSFGAVPSGEEYSGIQGLPQLPISYIGLILIGFGTGGIKPCVVSFGADQFVLPQQNEQMQTFFGIFYASINFGSMISTILTPIFRRQSCFGDDECYTLAFGVPAALMVVAIVFFVLGRPGYKVAIPENNIVKEFFQCIWEAIKQKRKATIKREHWLDYAEDRFGEQMVSDVKAVLRIAVIFLMYPLFWSLFEQQGSRWTFQATRMDGKVGSVQILPDQMQVINAALILIFIPIFDRIVYPLCDKIGILRTPLQKIVTGGMLLAISFIISGIVELILMKTYPHPPTHTTARFAIHNSVPDCNLNVIADLSVYANNAVCKLDAVYGKTSACTDEDGYELVSVPEDGGFEMPVSISVDGDKCATKLPTKQDQIVIQAKRSITLWAFLNKDGKVEYVTSSESDQVDKSDSGNPWTKAYFYLPGLKDDADATENSVNFVIQNDNFNGDFETRKGKIAVLPVPIDSDAGDTISEPTRKMGKFDFCLYGYLDNPKICSDDVADREYKYGASYTFYVIAEEKSDGTVNLKVEWDEILEPNKVHMLWLLPQYMILTAGEVLFSITSLSFAFTQAPVSMKAVVQALYLLTNAVGNLIDIIVIGSLSGLFSNQAQEFFFFAGFMILDMLVLAFLATRYVYVDYSGTVAATEETDNLPMDELKDNMSLSEERHLEGH